MGDLGSGDRPPLVLPRLYAILDIDVAAARGVTPLDVLDIWLAAGIRLIQVRAKTMASGPLVELADAMVARARSAGATLIVNDRADVARLSGADGVHLGQDDLVPRDARRVIGVQAIVGLSTHNVAQLTRALREPIDYAAIGPVFETTTKARPDPVVGLAGVAAAAALARAAGRPLVAIGGITLDRAPDVLAAGASAVAVVADLLSVDIAARARHFLRI